MANTIQIKSWGRGAALGLLLGVLSGCDGLLEVELPHLLTDAALAGPETVEIQINSAIALFECGSSAFAWVATGGEDAMQAIAGVASSAARFRSTPDTGGTCDAVPEDQTWFDQIMGARATISRDPALMTGFTDADGDARGVYDRIQNEWSLGVEGERFSAIASIYMAAVLAYFGEFHCEVAIDGSAFTPAINALTLGEEWITRGLGHITAAGGDFVMPHGAATSATDMAIALRARMRWARGDLANAAIDAATIADGFTAWITREVGEQRRNKIHVVLQGAKFAALYGRIDWWDGANKADKPGGGKWADPIPFTGYIFLGIDPADGRAVDANGYAVRWASEIRDANEDPIPVAGFSAADADTRVPHAIENIQGPGRWEIPQVYSDDGDDLPMITWQELRLIQAEQAAATGDATGAIEFVNVLRRAESLTEVSYIGAGATATELRFMILEERRRQLFMGAGRYLSTKIQNTDVLWFPRAEGDTPNAGYALFGGVRLLFAGDEYESNPLWEAAGGRDLRGTGCPADEAPFVI